MAKSNYLEDKALDHFLGTSSFTMPSNVYVALFTTDPTDAGSGTEVSGNGYARQSATFSSASGGSTSNSSAIEFTASGGSFGTVSHFGIFDALTSGNLLYHGALNASKTIADTDTLKISATGLTVNET
tara:strand:- start:2978 stop:3361 length:384 start_codon:yes stop_codon:yes gene_type:complete